MRRSSVRELGLRAAALLSLMRAVSGHSWIEMAYRIAPNGTMVGNAGYPRGYVPRDSTNPPFQDSIPVWLLPAAGQGAYSGDEILNKFPKLDHPAHPLLEAAAGEYIALMHLENGHTTLPQNQPKKPRNRGTIFFYGTSEPREHERLFDVHLVWTRDGKGGDGRGRLLATRNYDDGQCYQPNSGDISIRRAAELGPDGAVHAHELACQSDIKLPDDLVSGSIYTIYWYWDWPDLNADHMDVQATTNGIFPWAGTFMRGQKDPHGFTMSAIAKNESYASTIDIRITDGGSDNFGSKHFVASEYVARQDIYQRAIWEQLESNFQVDVDGPPGAPPATMTVSTATTAAVTETAAAATTMTTTTTTTMMKTKSHLDEAPLATAAPVTMTVTRLVTQQPSTVWVTVTKPQAQSTVVRVVTTHVPGSREPQVQPTVTPFRQRRWNLM